MAEIDLRNSTLKLSPLSPELEAERLKYIAKRIGVQVIGRSQDRYKLDAAPSDLHYEWHRDTPHTRMRLSDLGFVRNDELGKTSPFKNPEDNGIGDVVCWSIPKWQQEANEHVAQLRRKMLEDPRNTIKSLEADLKGEDGKSYTGLPTDAKAVSEGKSAQSLDTQITGKEAVAAILEAEEVAKQQLANHNTTN